MKPLTVRPEGERIRARRKVAGGVRHCKVTTKISIAQIFQSFQKWFIIALDSSSSEVQRNEPPEAMMN